jgi:hypothetical protein
MKTFWKNYNLSIVLLFLFLGTWILQFFAEWQEVWNDAHVHGETFTWSEFWPKFFSSTFQNWQSEFLQLFTFVVLTTYLIHKGSAESRDGQDRLEKKLDRLLDVLDKSSKK